MSLQQVTSVQHTRDVVVRRSQSQYTGLCALSVKGNGNLITGALYSKQIYVVDLNNIEDDPSIINIHEGIGLLDAAWIPAGRIVFTTHNSPTVTVVSEDDYDDITRIDLHVGKLQHISVSFDDAIYVTDTNSGVYQSRDDGVTWSHVFSSPRSRWSCREAIKVSTDPSRQTEDFVAIGEDKSVGTNAFRLRMYTVDWQNSTDGLTWRDITLPGYINMKDSRMGYDGYGNVFLTDSDAKAVHVLALIDGYQMLTHKMAVNISNVPASVAVVRQQNQMMMYVGHQKGNTVSVYTLMYKNTN